ncbi:sulfurtransferase TusA family protein [Thiohalobacter thiocyanaticus]|uniref:Sulfurtransferase TusA family protein n=1 Tax=Thiohalobacter thiocyanaticus TaxID=585455 RepID=A0A426QK87_9GAMM|nr:sulfurtransferase TusA family protein [Thiohalobacter thiocyanaticus]RRQ22126.1 sulfurtransferase TusA family protein [Thiohalobacter thiocyanaticus]
MWWFGRKKQRQASAIRQVERTVTLAGYGPLQVHVQIDCLGAVCPRPQLLCMRALDHMAPGEVLELVVDNPSTAEAIPAMDMTLGSTHLLTVRDDESWHIYVRKEALEAED